MSVHALTVIAKVKPGEEESLRQVLKDIGPGMFAKSSSTHVANFVILNDKENGPRLFFTSYYDGDLRDYLRELLQVAPQMHKIWDKCEGYTGPRAFMRFIRRHAHPAQALFIALRNESVQSIRREKAIRQQIEQFLSLEEVARYMRKPGLAPFFDLLSQIPRKRALPNPLQLLTTKLWKLAHGAFFGIYLAFARWYGSLIVDNNFVSVAADVGKQMHTTVTDTLASQDQMTNMIEVKPGYRLRIRLALAMLNFLARYGFEPGDLAGVKTIHFACWVLVDGGKRLLFQSKFDGSWENYMGDFVDKVSWGLDAVWENTVNYPSAGMRDIWAFKRFIRDHQFEFQIAYSAYPQETVTNIITSDYLCAPLGRGFDPTTVEGWLGRL
jgi:hypothetical protein